jgi:hypothetical protein
VQHYARTWHMFCPLGECVWTQRDKPGNKRPEELPFPRLFEAHDIQSCTKCQPSSWNRLMMGNAASVQQIIVMPLAYIGGAW